MRQLPEDGPALCWLLVKFMMPLKVMLDTLSSLAGVFLQALGQVSEAQCRKNFGLLALVQFMMPLKVMLDILSLLAGVFLQVDCTGDREALPDSTALDRPDLQEPL